MYLSRLPTDSRPLPGGIRAHLLGLPRLWPALLPALLFAPVVWSAPLNHDVAAVLDFSQRWLAGEHLYTDLIDVNPPLIFVLNLIPAAIARWTPLGAVTSLEICLAAWGMLAWILTLAARDRAAEGFCERAFLDVLPALFLFGAGYDYGQREHLMAVAALAYLLCAAGRERGGRPKLRIASAIFAALGFALKPHFLAVPALVESLVLVGRIRDLGPRAGIRAALRDPVPWTMAAVWLAYLASLPLLFPEYLGFVVPLVWGFYLSLGDSTALEILLSSRMATALALLLPALAITMTKALRREFALPRMLAAGAIGALASALAQHKGWSYHIVPIELFSLALALVVIASWLDRAGAIPTPRQGVRAAAALAGAFVLYGISNGEAPWREMAYGKSPVAGLSAIFAQHAAGGRILVMSPWIYPIYPALNYADARAALRTMNMWLLEGAYTKCAAGAPRYRDPADMGAAESYAWRTIPEDLLRAPPEMIVIDRQSGIPACDGVAFDFLTYFARNSTFAETFSHYRPAGELAGYRMYVRNEKP